MMMMHAPHAQPQVTRPNRPCAPARPMSAHAVPTSCPLANCDTRQQLQPEQQSAHGRQPTSSLASSAAAVAAAALVSLHALLCPSEAAARAVLTPDERVAIDIYKKSTPSVVNVANMSTRPDAFTMNVTQFPQGQGSGFIYDKQGHIVTNFHVITDATEVKVTLNDGNEYKAKVVGTDPEKDIAVLQLDEATMLERKVLLKPLPVCDAASGGLQVGQKVFAIGNPFGFDHTLTVGVVSGTGREIQGVTGRPIQDAIQTDAAINPGNSGGPLLDTSGCIIGINTAIYSPSGANTGVGFAIPSEVVKSSVQQIVAFGKVVRPALGIAFAPDQSSEQLGIRGILVLNAKEGGPAFKAGLQGTSRDEYGRLVLGDIITGINGKNIKNAFDLYRVLDRCKVGDALDMEVLRASSTEHVKIVLEPSDA